MSARDFNDVLQNDGPEAGRNSFDPAATLILDRKAPMPSAERLVASAFTQDGVRSLHHYREIFWLWNGSFYRKLDGDMLRSIVWNFLDNAKTIINGELLPFKPTGRQVSDVTDALTALCQLSPYIETPHCLKGTGAVAECAPQDLLAVGNGLLHPPSRTLHPATPNLFCLTGTEVPFIPTARAPLWKGFLDQLWPNDPISVETLGEWFGYCLEGWPTQHKIMMLVGPMRGGKGTIAATLRLTVGAPCCAAPTLGSFDKDFGMQPLIGKALGIIHDARISARANLAAIAERLLSISGGDPQSVNRKNKDFWDGHLLIRFLMITNELPKLADASGALASRFIILMLRNSWLGREDLTLTDRLATELPGVLNWALDGRDRLKQRGRFRQPESANAMVEQFEAITSPIKAFIADECEVNLSRSVDVDVLFEVWRKWCEGCGRDAGDKTAFGRDLRAAVPDLDIKQHRPPDGSPRRRRYTGIGLKKT